MKNMGNTFKWPWKTNNPDPKWDVTKYCEFHGDYGHSTPDCISLRFEVADLLKRITSRTCSQTKARTHSTSARHDTTSNLRSLHPRE